MIWQAPSTRTGIAGRTSRSFASCSPTMQNSPARGLRWSWPSELLFRPVLLFWAWLRCTKCKQTALKGRHRPRQDPPKNGATGMRSMQDSGAARGQTDRERPARLARAKGAVSTAIGGGVAIALMITVGSWVWGLGTRDPSSVPIIRASTEPAKMRPDDPGGTNAPYQEISSYQLAGSSNAPTASAAYAPPPPEPRREDLAMGTLASTSGEAARAEPVAH